MKKSFLLPYIRINIEGYPEIGYADKYFLLLLKTILLEACSPQNSDSQKIHNFELKFYIFIDINFLKISEIIDLNSCFLVSASSLTSLNQESMKIP